METVLTAKAILENSNWTSWPHGQGWLAEDYALVQDVLLLTDLEAYIKVTLEENEKGEEDD